MSWFTSKRTWIWAAAVMVAVLALGMLAAALVGKMPAGQRLALITPLGEWETDPALWGRNFPRQYQSWLRTQESPREDIGYGPGRSKWGGLRPEQRDPGAAFLYAGYSLSRDSEGMPRAGKAGASRHPAVCLDCHDPKTMALRVSRQAFVAAMTRRGVDVARASRQSLRTYVCAQCHVTHSVFGPEEGPRMPWGRGLSSDDIVATYREDAAGFSDWTHAVSKAPMIRIRHPEFELWSQGIHAARGVSCADCHMPTQVEGSTRISSHFVKSPLLAQVPASCMVCHHWGGKELQVQVELIQDRTMALQKRAAMALCAAHAAVGDCSRAGIPDQPLIPVRALLREAQARWDFIAAEGSVGFHAPQEAARVMAIAIDQARQAERDALLLKAKIPGELPKH